MLKNRFIISGLIINSLAACSSSPMELSQPKGDWVDFDSSPARTTTPANAGSNVLNSLPATQYAVSTGANQNRTVSVQPAASADKDSFVTASGKHVPLFSAVRSIVPASWTVKLSPEVSAGFKGTLSWDGNDQWPYVLKKSLNAAGLTPVMDDRRKEVTVKFVVPAKTEASKVTPVMQSRNSIDMAKKPLIGGMLTPPVVPVITPPFKQPVINKALPVMPVVVASPAPVKPALRTWVITKGSTLRKGYEQWVSGESCSGQNGKWSVRWDSATDYPIDYPLTFTAADFEAATSQLFNLYQHAQVPLFVNGFRQQCLIVISDRK